MAGNWTPQQKRCYQRIMSGLTRHEHQPLRFMTLTMAPGCTRDMPSAWCALKERIRRRQPGFEYLKIHTWEGNGVLHILVFGGYIAQGWLSANWNQLTGAPIVDIRQVHYGKQHRRRLARYIICQEIAGQEFYHMSWSWGWVFKGFVKVWQALKKEVELSPLGLSREALLNLWHRIITGDTLTINGVTFQFLFPRFKDIRIMFQPTI